jgi:hypothetical protein
MGMKMEREMANPEKMNPIQKPDAPIRVDGKKGDDDAYPQHGGKDGEEEDDEYPSLQGGTTLRSRINPRDSLNRPSERISSGKYR